MYAIAGLLFAYFVYRHTSGKARYNRALIVIMFLLGVFPCLIAAVIGWHHNPRRAAGDDWRTAI